jgi:hypothetical protein
MLRLMVGVEGRLRGLRQSPMYSSLVFAKIYIIGRTTRSNKDFCSDTYSPLVLSLVQDFQVKKR